MTLTKTAPIALAIVMTVSMSFSAPQPLELIKKAKSMKNLASAPAKLAKSTISGDNIPEMQFMMEDYPEGVTSSQDDTLEGNSWEPKMKSAVTRNAQGKITEIIESEYYDGEWEFTYKETRSYDASGRISQYAYYSYFSEEWSVSEISTYSYASNRVYMTHENDFGDMSYDTLKYYPGNIPDTLFSVESHDGEDTEMRTIFTYDQNDSLVSASNYTYDATLGWFEMARINFSYEPNEQTIVMKMNNPMTGSWIVVDSSIAIMNDEGQIISTEEHLTDPFSGSGSSSSTTEYTWSGDRCTQMLTTHDDGGQTRTVYTYDSSPILSRSISKPASPIQIAAESKCIRLTIPQSLNVSLSVYTPDGKLAADLVENTRLKAGTQSISLPAYLAPGKYICTVKTEDFRSSSSFILVK
ncbi:MAG: hypothetical protein ACLFTW_15380 [Chitinispirillaceae bacterium]